MNQASSMPQHKLQHNITAVTADGMLYSAKQSHREFWKMPWWRQLSRKPWLNETNTPNGSQMHLQSVSALLRNSTYLLPMTILTHLPLTWNSESRHCSMWYGKESTRWYKYHISCTLLLQHNLASLLSRSEQCKTKKTAQQRTLT